jgi:Fe-S-cluster containining protein
MDVKSEFVETDIVKTKALARKKKDENWAFRSFLKESDIPSEEIDRIVHKLYKEVSMKIDCTRCANCCKELHPVLDDKDIERLCTRVGLSAVQVKEQYLVNDRVEPGRYVFREKPCPFLKDNLCTLSENRPKDCVSYPHLDKEGFVFRLIDVVQNCSVCPIVFNVYERLKMLVWDVGVQNTHRKKRRL